MAKSYRRIVETRTAADKNPREKKEPVPYEQRQQMPPASDPSIRRNAEWKWKILPDGTVEIKQYLGQRSKIEFPSKLDGRKVISIGEKVLGDLMNRVNRSMRDAYDKGCLPDTPSYTIFISDGITTIQNRAFEFFGYSHAFYIPSSITSIGNDAFTFCPGMGTFIMHEGTVSIGSKAFSGSDIQSVQIPSSVTHIGDNPFAACDSLKHMSIAKEHPFLEIIDGALYNRNEKKLIGYPGSIQDSKLFNIPYGTKSIGGFAFFGLRYLKKISIPDSVTSIGDEAFGVCPNLREIEIPDSVVSIGINPFLVCETLVKIKVSSRHPKFKIIDDMLFDKTEKKLICCPAGLNQINVKSSSLGTRKATTVIIPKGTLAIGEKAFEGCEGITSIILPKGTISIGEQAFHLCKNLTSVTIPGSVKTIDDYAFNTCSSEKAVVLIVEPDSYAEQYAREHKLQYKYIR